MAETSRVFHNIFTLSIVNEDIGGEVKTQSVDNGSIWIEVVVGPASVVAFVGALAKAAAMVYQQVQNSRVLGASVRITRPIWVDWC